MSVNSLTTCTISSNRSGTYCQDIYTDGISLLIAFYSLQQPELLYTFVLIDTIALHKNSLKMLSNTVQS